MIIKESPNTREGSPLQAYPGSPELPSQVLTINKLKS